MGLREGLYAKPGNWFGVTCIIENHYFSGVDAFKFGLLFIMDFVANGQNYDFWYVLSGFFFWWVNS